MLLALPESSHGTRIQEQEKWAKWFLSPGTVMPQYNLVSFNAIYNNIKE